MKTANDSRGWALVTGASSGIGLELAKLLAKDQFPLVLVARRKDQLESVAEECRKLGSPSVAVIVKDLAAPHATKELFAETEDHGYDIEILINNAGFGALGNFAESEFETRRRGLPWTPCVRTTSGW